MRLRNSLADLPEGQWNANVHSAYQLIQTSYQHAIKIIAEERLSDPIRLNVIASDLLDQRPYLLGLVDEGVSRAWVEECAIRFVCALEVLDEAVQSATGQ